MKAIFRVFFVIISALMVIWWLNVPFLDSSNGKSPSIVVTTPFLQEVVLELLGPDANITLLIERGQNPLTAAEDANLAAIMNESNFILMHGTAMDGPYQSIDTLKKDTAKVVNVAALLKKRGAVSEYFWLNLIDYTKVIMLIHEQFKVMFPETRSELDYRARAYTKKVYNSYQFIQANLSDQIKKMGVIATNHPSLQTLAKSIGLTCKLLSVPTQPSEEELLLLVKEIRDNNIQIMLPNQALPSSGITRLKDEAFDYDQSVRFANPVQTLTLGPVGAMNGTAIDLVENLVRSIING